MGVWVVALLGDPTRVACPLMSHAACRACSEYSSGNWLLNGEVVEPLDKTPLGIAVAAGDVEAATALLKAGGGWGVRAASAWGWRELGCGVRDARSVIWLASRCLRCNCDTPLGSALRSVMPLPTYGL